MNIDQLADWVYSNQDSLKGDNMIAFYHSPCMDGICSAWAFHQKYPLAKLIPLDYGKLDLPKIILECPNKDVYFLDCSLKHFEDVVGVAKSVTVIDHHISAESYLMSLGKEIKVIFDTKKSGAILTWEHCFPGHEIPRHLLYVDDRDRWVWKLPDSGEINAWIQSHSQTLEDIDDIQVEMFGNYLGCVEMGKAIQKDQRHWVDLLVTNRFRVKFLMQEVSCINTPMFISEVGHILAKLGPFGMTYFINSLGNIVFSLRSIGDYDVSKIAKMFGGGGHKNAAGFTVTSWPEAFERIK